MTNAGIQTSQEVWPRMAPVIFVPHAESEYQQLVTLLDDLIDVVGENGKSSLSLIDGDHWGAN